MPANIAHYFTQHFKDGRRALHRHYAHDAWQDVRIDEVRHYAERWQEAFRRDGLKPGDRVALCARNGIFWVAIDQAALGLGLVVVPLYADDNPDNIAWCAQNAEVKLFIADNRRMADALAALGATYTLPRIVVLRPDTNDDPQGAQRFLPVGGPGFECHELAPETLATICYTSGTSGRPKGVMLSHANIVANVEQCRATGLGHADDVFLSILPLSHMFERTGGYYLPLALGAKVVYARGIAQIADDLVSEAPTAMFAVPRIFEKFHAKVQEALAKSPAKRWLFDACTARGYRVARGRATLLDRLVVPLLRTLVAKPVLARLGGRMRLAVVGGAAFDPAIATAFIGLGLPVLQGYGMTEASPVISVNHSDDNVPESVGPPLPGVDVKLGDGGELMARGANVMLGYWRNVEATRAALMPDGWLRTGDIAEIRDGHIYIRGRAKDIMVMSNGEKLSPQDAELAILHDSAFEQVMLVGEGKPYPILLAVTKETDEKALQRRVNDLLKAFPRWVRVRRVIATKEAWTIDNGLLTPTLKLKRPLVLAHFKAAIDAAYAAPPERDG
ncbi:MAG TPA: AMP-dependent synthetase/ligase [Casimicrobiaceae bacterium]|jgi:long-chain acyl-CoA synthetase